MHYVLLRPRKFQDWRCLGKRVTRVSATRVARGGGGSGNSFGLTTAYARSTLTIMETGRRLKARAALSLGAMVGKVDFGCGVVSASHHKGGLASLRSGRRGPCLK